MLGTAKSESDISLLVNQLQSIALRVHTIENPIEAISSTLQEVCDTLSFNAGQLYMAEEREEVARARSTGIWNTNLASDYQDIRDQSRGHTWSDGVGIIGEVLDSRQLQSRDISTLTNFLYPEIQKLGNRSVVAVPVSSTTGKVYGVMEFYSTHIPRLGDIQENLLAIGTHMGIRLEREEMRDARERAEQKVLNSQEALSELLRQFQHNIGTALNAVSMSAGAMVHESFGPLDQKYREYARDMERTSLEAREGVDRMTYLTMLRSGQIKIDMGAYDPIAVFNQVKTKLDQKYAKRGIEVALITEPGLVHRVEGDKEKVERTLFEIMDNAYKYTENQQHAGITVNLSYKNGYVIFQVQNRGEGMPQELLDRAQEGMPCIQGSQIAHGQGWGIGLLIAHKLARLQKGYITSENVGQGHRVSCYISDFKRAEGEGNIRYLRPTG